MGEEKKREKKKRERSGEREREREREEEDRRDNYYIKNGYFFTMAIRELPRC